MRIHSFDWEEKNENHIAEHGVAIFEVEDAILFSNPFYQRSRENKYIAYSVTEEGRYLFIVFVIKGNGRRQGYDREGKALLQKEKGIKYNEKDT